VCLLRVGLCWPRAWWKELAHHVLSKSVEVVPVAPAAHEPWHVADSCHRGRVWRAISVQFRTRPPSSARRLSRCASARQKNQRPAFVKEASARGSAFLAQTRRERWQNWRQTVARNDDARPTTARAPKAIKTAAVGTNREGETGCGLTVASALVMSRTRYMTSRGRGWAGASS